MLLSVGFVSDSTTSRSDTRYSQLLKVLLFVCGSNLHDVYMSNTVKA